MSLCELCSNLNIITNPSPHSSTGQILGLLEHHASFYDLSRSATDGCALCIRFRIATVNTAKSAHNSFLRQEEWTDETTIADLYRHDSLSAEYAGFTVRPCFLRLDGKASANLATNVLLGLAYCPKDTSQFARGSVDGSGLGTWVQLSSASEDVSISPIRLLAQKPDLEVCKSWIQSCSRSHKACDRIADATLPTRVIDVDSDNGAAPRLVETGHKRGRYVTLSHCWGDKADSHLKTDVTNYDSHLESLSILSMSQTFQDAIAVTKALGFRYLWIDSLCIIQGDDPKATADWQRECSRMRQVYADSAVTIAAAASTASSTGLLGARQPMFPYPVEVTLLIDGFRQKLIATMSDDTCGKDVASAAGPIPMRPWPEIDSPLSFRGWILQERLLSQRVLYFGSRQAYYECKTATSYECTYPLFGWNEIRGPGLNLHAGRSKPHLFKPPEDAHTASKDWLALVELYSKCELTKPKDKLPALSGLAALFANYSLGRYLAGLWECYLPIGLAWRRSGRFQGEHRAAPKSIEPDDWVAPSWSWASQPQTVISCPIFGPRDGPTTPLLELEHAECHPKGGDPFGEVSRPAALCLLATIWTDETCAPGVRSSPTTVDNGLPPTSIRLPYTNQSLKPDYDDWEESLRGETQSCGRSSKATTITCLSLYRGHGQKGVSYYHSIAVSPVPGEPNTYKRWGLVSGSVSDGTPRARMVEDKLANAPRQRVRLV